MNKDRSERLNKYIAYHLGVSRREADSYISKSAVLVNGIKAELGARVDDKDIVTVHGTIVTKKSNYTYIVLHKPVGYVCSRRPQGDSPTVYELLPRGSHHLKLVGRLDKDSSGIILLTDDGIFSHHMTHPSYYKSKIYNVSLDHELEPLHQQMISDYGIQLEDGPSKLLLTRQNESNRKHWIVEMHEGRNRQIRRTFAALGYTVVRLHRTQFGDYSLGDIKPGSWQELHIS
jgi:23S rRNA pseudouridine2605 synthase